MGPVGVTWAWGRIPEKKTAGKKNRKNRGKKQENSVVYAIKMEDQFPTFGRGKE